MRKGQLFSMDALVSIVLVIMILGTVSATSENLRGEITSMIGWYERANVADNMLDVLTKSPGEPPDWYLPTSENLRSVGLKSPGSMYLEYSKLEALVNEVSSNNTTVIDSLCQLSGGNNFEMLFHITNSSMNASVAINTYEISTSSALSACYPSELPENTSVVVDCPLGTFYFINVNGDNVYENDYGSVCVLDPVYIIGQGSLPYQVVINGGYFAVNGTLALWQFSQLTVTGGDIYVNGNLYIELAGNPWASSILVENHNVYVNGVVYAYKGEFIIDNGALYVFNPESSSPAISISRGQGNAPGGLIVANVVYIYFENYWFAIIGDPLDETNWYVNINGGWVPLTSTNILFYTFLGDVYINGGLIIDNADLLVITGGALDEFDSSFEFTDVAPPCILYVEQVTVLQLSVPTLNITYSMPSPLDDRYWRKIAVINCTYVDDEITIMNSKYTAPWVDYTERIVPVTRKVYSTEYVLNSSELPKELYFGIVDQYISDVINITFVGDATEGNLTLISAFTTPDYSGYSIVALLKTQNGWLYGANMTYVYPTYNVSKIPEDCKIIVSDDHAEVSMSCLVPPTELDKSVTVTVWAYSLEGFSQVIIKDLGNLDVYLKPAKQMGIIQLWVWPRR